MLPFLGMIFGPIAKIVGGWVEHKQKIAAATRNAEIKWAHTMADASKTSLKDEYILFLWTIPILLAIFGYDEPMVRFLELLNQLPVWYTSLLVTLSLATFGISAKGKWEKLVSKRNFNKATEERGHGTDFGPTSD